MLYVRNCPCSISLYFLHAHAILLQAYVVPYKYPNKSTQVNKEYQAHLSPVPPKLFQKTCRVRKTRLSYNDILSLTIKSFIPLRDKHLNNIRLLFHETTTARTRCFGTVYAATTPCSPNCAPTQCQAPLRPHISLYLKKNTREIYLGNNPINVSSALRAGGENMKAITYSDCIKVLEKDELQNIILLKHASFLNNSAQYFLLNSSIGITFTPDKMQHDRVLYPDFNSITILSNTNDINIYLSALQQGKHIIKVNGSLPDNIFTLIQSFKSLTSQKIISPISNLNLYYETNIESKHYTYLFGLINYSIEDIKQLITNNSAYVLSIKDNAIPICSCIVYQAYNNVWEIGALVTDEKHRRKKLAENLVLNATNLLLSKGLIPRYHVNMNNMASYNLAIKCGYEPFIHFNHYSYIKFS